MSRRLSDLDRRAWARVARTVRPAPGRVHPIEDDASTGAGRMSAPVLPKANTRSAQPREPQPLPGPLADLSNQRLVRRGRLAVDARLDLHGHTQESAERELADFILRQRSLGARSILVITGKGRLGGGVLRSRFLDWIKGPALRPLIAGYSRAHPRHGGEGAFYLLLKLKRD